MGHQIFKLGLSDALSCVPDPESLVVNVHIAEPVELHVKLLWAVSCKKGMSMSVDESGKGNQIGAVFGLFEDNLLSESPLFYFCGGANFGDETLAIDSDGDVVWGFDLGALLKWDEALFGGQGDNLTDIRK